jgi:hypothetical protein
LYKAILPLAQHSIDELNFTKDSLAQLVKLLHPLNTKLGRPHDPEVDKLLQEYDLVYQMRQKLQNEPITEPITTNPPVIPDAYPHIPPQPITMDPRHHATPFVEPHIYQAPSPHPPPKEVEKPRTSSAPRPTISDPRTLSQYSQANIDMLYNNLKHRCSTCGLRFKTTEELATHLDWHYFERTSHIGRQGNRGIKLQRQWYLSAKEWVETNGGTTGQAVEEKTTVKTKELNGEAKSEKKIVRISDAEHDHQAMCHACGDDIDQPEYDEFGWFYPNTLKGPDDHLYHVKCAPESFVTLNSSTNNLSQSTEIGSPNKKRPHEEETFDELVVTPEAKRAKLEESNSN